MATGVSDNLFENAAVSHGEPEASSTTPNAEKTSLNTNTDNALSTENAGVGQSPSGESANKSIQPHAQGNTATPQTSTNRIHRGTGRKNASDGKPNLSSQGAAENETGVQDMSVKGAQPNADVVGKGGIAETGGTGSAETTESISAGADAVTGAGTEAAGAGASAGTEAAAGNGLASGISAAGHAITSTASNLMSAAGHTVTSLAQSAVGWIQGLAGAVTGAVGTAGAIVGASAVIGVAGVGGVAIYNSTQTDPAKYEDLIVEEECEVEDATTATYLSYSDVDADAQKIENASKVYSIMKAYGWSDELCAGLIGSMEAECGIDPTCIEYMESTERYTYGPKKQALFNSSPPYLPTAAMNSWVETTIAALQRTRPDINLNTSIYRNGGNGCVGIGLFQFTGNAAYEFLDYAASFNAEWYTIDIQMQYMISPNGCWRYKFCENPSAYTKYPIDTPENCALWTSWYLAGGTVDLEKRERYAAEWFVKLAELNYDVDYGKSIIQAANANVDAATTAALGEAEDCEEEDTSIFADNSSLSNAAIAMSWPTKEQAKYNNGTELYQKVLKAVGDATGHNPTYMACSDFTYAAIKWSGTDDDFVVPNCANQLKYLKSNGTSSGKWQYIGNMTDDSAYAQLQPGDLIIKDGHTYIWLGWDAIEEYYNTHGLNINDVQAGANCAMASLGTRSAGLQGDSKSQHGVPFQIWRCVNPTGESSKYIHLLDGVDSNS